MLAMKFGRTDDSWPPCDTGHVFDTLNHVNLHTGPLT